MLNIHDLRLTDFSIAVLGSHPGIIQSVLDYDYMVGRKEPSIAYIIAQGRKVERYFWGEDEVMIPVVASLDLLSDGDRSSIKAVINVQSARRVLASTTNAVKCFSNLKVIVIFAEQTLESHAIKLHHIANSAGVMIIGPSSVGILLPGYAKIGAIGGTQYEQLVNAKISTLGDTAVVSTSGGMVNELIHMVTSTGRGVSFAVALGGDRYPITNATDTILAAEHDDKTEQIVYFGELGGTDEYEIANLIKSGQLTKKIIVYIAGVVAELFETPPQFGHAKAMAQTDDESASAKKNILREYGAIVCDSITEMTAHIADGYAPNSYTEVHAQPTIGPRRKRSIVSHISGDKNNEMQLLGHDLLDTVNANSMASLTISLLLGQQVKSQKLIEFTDYVTKLLVDHGPYVSGAVNTIITARAGRDLVSGLSAGLLTIGPRFGGAINAANGGWIRGANHGLSPKSYLESFASQGGIIPGIGHKKYRIDMPDPRVEALVQFTKNKNGDRYFNYARSIERVTTVKKGNLILNIDGAIGAIMLDILESELGYTKAQLQELVDIEFFNALFVLSRSIGFTSHYLDQRRHDEGLYRLDPDDVRYIA